MRLLQIICGMLITVGILGYAGFRRLSDSPSQDQIGAVKNALRRPEILADYHFDLGNVAPNVEVVREFTLRNRTDRDWRIARTIVECSCTVAAVKDRVVRPGEDLGIRVGIRTGDRFSSVVHRILVEMDDAKQVMLLLDANVCPSIALSTKELPFSMAQSADRSPEMVVEVRHYGDEDWESLSVDAPVSWIKWRCETAQDVVAANPDEARRDSRPLRQVWRLFIAVDPLESTESQAAFVRISRSGAEENASEHAMLSVSSRHIPKLRLVPPNLFFGKIVQNGQGTAGLKIMLNDEHSMDSTSFVSVLNVPGTAEVRIQKLSESVFELNATLLPGNSVSGLLKGELEITIAGEDGSSVRVPVTAWIESE